MTRWTSMTRRLLVALGLFGLPLSASAQMAVEYYHLDAIGNVLVTTDTAGTVVEQHDYDVFGQEVNVQAGAQPKRFTGKERDQETGWDYFGARHYGSKIGRFTTVDPVYTWQENLVDPQRWNRYAYARNNPLRYIDPNGEQVAEAIRQLGQQAQGFHDQRALAIGGALIIVAANIDKLADIGQAIVESGAFSGSQPLYPGVDIGMDPEDVGPPLPRG